MSIDGAEILNGKGIINRCPGYEPRYLARVHVTAIQRIVNPMLQARFSRWCTKHKAKTAKAPERFHGTDSKAAHSIAKEGFDLNKGNGAVWVATRADYSVNFSLYRNRDSLLESTDYPTGLTMLLVRVWTGNPKQDFAKNVDQTIQVANVAQTWPTHLIHFDLVPV